VQPTEIPEHEFQEISLDSIDDENNEDEHPDLISSATFGLANGF
jgi:hypothetical protein